MPQEASQPAIATAPAPGEDMGVHKDGASTTGVTTGAVKEFVARSIGAKAELDAGVVRAVAAAFEQFNDELRPDGKLRLDMVNGIIEGTASGLRAFFTELSRVSEQARATYVAYRVRMPASEIDYDRLAELVAQKIADKKP